MTQLSVNINKIAWLRNARGQNIPDLIKAAKDIESYGAHGITVHPRPDQRHITYDDVRQLKKNINTVFNIEGNPKEKKFIDLIIEIKPQQVTLVPDNNLQLTSNQGWDTVANKLFLTETIALFKSHKIITSIFINPNLKMIQAAQEIATDRIELFTQDYAHLFSIDKALAISSFIKAANLANDLNIGVNAGHDLNLQNLKYFKQNIKNLLEVSIGHALISDALYFGLENTVQMYLRQLK